MYVCTYVCVRMCVCVCVCFLHEKEKREKIRHLELGPLWTDAQLYVHCTIFQPWYVVLSCFVPYSHDSCEARFFLHVYQIIDLQADLICLFENL